MADFKGERLTRRGALSTLGGLGLSLGAAPALAKAPKGGLLRPVRYRAALGAFEVSTVFDGAIMPGTVAKIFGEDQDEATVKALMAENNLPGDNMEIGFTPVVLNTGNEVILFDAGNGAARRPNAGKLRARLAEIDLTPEQIDVVVITHFHPDHIGGLMEGDAPAYPNARYVIPSAEYDFWVNGAGASIERIAKLTASNVVPLAEMATMIGDGEDVVSGVTAMAAHGHTPGHTLYHIESEGRRLLITADTANHFVASLQRPDWHVRFDMDKAAGGATRKKIFDMVAADKIPFTGYHMPFPAIGYVEKDGVGYRYTPHTYQLHL